MKKIILILSILATIASSAQAWDTTAQVTTIEPSYMSDKILFKLNKDAGNCSAGSWLWYHGTHYQPTDLQSNVKSIHATLLSALLSGKNVAVHGQDNCVPINIHQLSQ